MYTEIHSIILDFSRIKHLDLSEGEIDVPSIEIDAALTRQEFVGTAIFNNRRKVYLLTEFGVAPNLKGLASLIR